ncbi:quinoprotein dehydrogenase-associated SoxYZ-like carrier [Novosphingobium decolorationis]|uniref:Quinoprotein dehydrogenase-associated SoxYZ-like carrier n=1 Tax=Novosphingobium decolorationis TaxID=2698673 RepID=A0ABX8E7J0_9SPHN|nr:quinoprotein dehydrogenase-associated SoxYZ-like carrier [Novosphingobium decolorationis]MED5546235.1 quinoprotein dehydrogenase-associated SoxYZ-like carrier [Pseudomonadota bacterium]QVM84176.1 quinoprotein dehydrogenase-associated SoxYZ-like carrier [Novosphingobium decolorationis]
MKRLALFSALMGQVAPARAATATDLPTDPLGSPMWTYHAERLFAGARVVFDAQVGLAIPGIAENQRIFPVMVDARALPDVTRLLIFADLNPIPLAIDYRPLAARSFLATRIKLDQRTPVRAAVQTRDGTWHVAGQWIDAAGGGCSAPPVSRVKGDWAEHLGEMRGQTWAEGEDTRLRLTLRHPMDTGLVENIPAYNLETLRVLGEDGRERAHVAVSGAVAEDPAFTLLLAGREARYRVIARDTSGREFEARIEGPTP